MPEAVHQSNIPGPVTLKVNAPDLPLRVTVAEGITHAHIHAVGSGGIILMQTGRTVTVTTGSAPGERPPSLLSRLFGGSRASSGRVHAPGGGGIAAGGSIRDCATGDGSIIRVGNSGRISVSGGSVASSGDLTFDDFREPKRPGVYVQLPPGSRVVAEGAALVEVDDSSLLAGFTG